MTCQRPDVRPVAQFFLLLCTVSGCIVLLKQDTHVHVLHGRTYEGVRQNFSSLMSRWEIWECISCMGC